MSLPPGHSGYAHVKATGHALALSTFAVSNCAECEWASFVGYVGCPELVLGEVCWTPEDCRALFECRHLYRWSLEERDEASELRRFIRRSNKASDNDTPSHVDGAPDSAVSGSDARTEDADHA